MMSIGKRITTTDWNSAANPNFLLRVRADTAKSSTLIGVERESEVVRQIAEFWGQQHNFVSKTLGEAIDSLKKALDYNGVYNAFLLDQLSEDEFEQQSLEFMSEPSSTDAKLVTEQIQILLKHTKSDFTTSEISEIFQATEETVENAILQLSLNLEEIQTQTHISALTENT